MSTMDIVSEDTGNSETEMKAVFFFFLKENFKTEKHNILHLLFKS